MAGLDNYNYSSKRNWRRWAWNTIKEKLEMNGIQPRDAIGLYLCGPDDIDRQIALSKGFRNENLIAVDKDPQCIKFIKQAKNIGICSDITSVISSWGVYPKIDFIFADFIGGMSKTTTVDFIAVLKSAQCLSSSSVIAINLLCGRDGFINPFKEFAKERHRGKLFVSAYSVYELFTKHTDPYCSTQIGHRWIQLIERGMRFHLDEEYFEYKTKSGHKYQSVIFVNYAHSRETQDSFSIPNVSTKIRAMKAVRTMRMEGTL